MRVYARGVVRFSSGVRAPSMCACMCGPVLGEAGRYLSLHESDEHARGHQGSCHTTAAAHTPSSQAQPSAQSAHIQPLRRTYLHPRFPRRCKSNPAGAHARRASAQPRAHTAHMHTVARTYFGGIVKLPSRDRRRGSRRSLASKRPRSFPVALPERCCGPVVHFGR